MPRLYVNPGGEDFQSVLNEDIYVDKTLILAELNKFIGKKRHFICMARPRRFGKSYVGDLIRAYYSRGCDCRALFRGLKMEADPSFMEHLGRYNVISLDIGGLYSKYPEHHHRFFDLLGELVRTELIEEYPTVDFAPKPNVAADIEAVYTATGHKFVVFLDEYDALVRTRAPQKTFDAYLDFLNGLFKEGGGQQAIALAYITGILPIVRDRFQSKLNNFEEYTFLNPEQFAPFMGFTEGEAKDLCDRYAMSFDECKLWYDGYRLGAHGTSVLAPLSVCEAMKRKRYDDFWSQTSIFDSVLDVMKVAAGPDFRSKVLTLMKGGRVPVNTKNYRNTLDHFEGDDDVLTFCIHLGYLGYDQPEEECYIPNNEVRMQWAPILRGLDGNDVLYKVLDASKRLLKATIRADEAAVAQGLQAAHDAVCTAKGYNDEAAFQAAISYAYYYAQNAYTILKELPTGRGFADVVFLPKYPSLGFPAMVMELKVDTAVQTAMTQIENRGYGSDLLHYRGEMMLVGVSYNSKTRAHRCRIKRFVVE